MTLPLLMSLQLILLLRQPVDSSHCPDHLSPCTCAGDRRRQPQQHDDIALEVDCRRVEAGQLREVMDVLSLTRQRVWFLHVGDTDLSDFPNKMLQGLDLTNLVLVRSNISSFSPTTFSGLRLESLDLSSNELTRVPTRSLALLKTTLSALNLDFNHIETLEAHAFGELESLLWLSLYGNRIRLVDSRAFLGTEGSLTRLNLGGNRLGQVPRYALQRLACLQGLRLHDNRISQVLVSNLPTSLCDLDLSGNLLTRLDSDSFSTLGHLSALDLEDNKIETIHEDAFRGIHGSLEWLKLGGNLLNRIPRSGLRRLTRIRQLDLRRNRISRIEEDDFRGYGITLRFIFLQRNTIRTIEEGALEELDSAEWLYLHSNEMTELRHVTFRPIIDRLHVIDLHGNPFRCDCHMLWLRDWLLAKGRDVANLPRETQCNETGEPVSNLIDGIACSSSSPHEQLALLLITVVLLLVCR